MKLPRWFAPKRPEPTAGAASTPPADLDRVFPLVVPAGLAELGDWPGPIHRLAAQRCALTWGVCLPDDILRYVSREDEAGWDAQGLDWRGTAMDNLKRLAGRTRYSGYLQRRDGSICLITFLEAYGLGPARLLLPGLFDDIFPEGYRVAIPEMTCALAFSVRQAPEDQAKVDEMIARCFAEGTRPFSPQVLEPQDLWTIAGDDLGAPD